MRMSVAKDLQRFLFHSPSGLVNWQLLVRVGFFSNSTPDAKLPRFMFQASAWNLTAFCFKDKTSFAAQAPADSGPTQKILKC